MSSVGATDRKPPIPFSVASIDIDVATHPFCYPPTTYNDRGTFTSLSLQGYNLVSRDALSNSPNEPEFSTKTSSIQCQETIQESGLISNSAQVKDEATNEPNSNEKHHQQNETCVYDAEIGKCVQILTLTSHLYCF